MVKKIIEKKLRKMGEEITERSWMADDVAVLECAILWMKIGW